MMEFELIERYFLRPALRNDVALGGGDDCALLLVPNGQELAVTMDTMVSGVHFPLETEPYAIGWKSLAVNLSDLAAMGAEPAWATLALTIPEAKADWLNAFSRGLFDLADQYQVALVGGDTTRGPLAITMQAHGFIPQGQALRRAGAQVGDLIYVTGTLGDAMVGLELRQGQQFPSLTSVDQCYLLERLDRPQPRVAAGCALRGIASAAIDLSDGLIADLGHILKASAVGAVLDVADLPRSSALKKLVVPWDKIVGGGDDYELCFTIPPTQQESLNQLATTIAVTKIGVIQAASGIIWHNGNSQAFNINATGFRHFS